MQHRIWVKASRDSLGHWIVQYEEYDGHDKVAVPGTWSGSLVGWAWDEASERYYIDVYLRSALYRLIAQVNLGGKVEVMLRPEPAVIDPPDRKWPLVVDLSPSTAAGQVELYYFRVGDHP